MKWVFRVVALAFFLPLLFAVWPMAVGVVAIVLVVERKVDAWDLIALFGIVIVGIALILPLQAWWFGFLGA